MICSTRWGGGKKEVKSAPGIESFYIFSMGLVFGVVRPHVYVVVCPILCRRISPCALYVVVCPTCGQFHHFGRKLHTLYSIAELKIK